LDPLQAAGQLARTPAGSRPSEPEFLAQRVKPPDKPKKKIRKVRKIHFHASSQHPQFASNRPAQQMLTPKPVEHVKKVVEAVNVYKDFAGSKTPGVLAPYMKWFNLYKRTFRPATLLDFMTLSSLERVHFIT